MCTTVSVALTRGSDRIPGAVVTPASSVDMTDMLNTEGLNNVGTGPLAMITLHSNIIVTMMLLISSQNVSVTSRSCIRLTRMLVSIWLKAVVNPTHLSP